MTFGHWTVFKEYLSYQYLCLFYQYPLIECLIESPIGGIGHSLKKLKKCTQF